jgi:hypothetical protein
MFDDNKNHVTFSLDFLRISPNLKNVVPSINATKGCLLNLGLGMRNMGRELSSIVFSS